MNLMKVSLWPDSRSFVCTFKERQILKIQQLRNHCWIVETICHVTNVSNFDNHLIVGRIMITKIFFF